MHHQAVIAEHLDLPLRGCKLGNRTMSPDTKPRGKLLFPHGAVVPLALLPSCLGKLLLSSWALQSWGHRGLVAYPWVPSITSHASPITMLCLCYIPHPLISPLQLPKCSTPPRAGKSPIRLDFPLSNWLKMDQPQRLPITIAWLQTWPTSPLAGEKGSCLLPGGLLWVAAWQDWMARQCFFL